jgi:SsrA-binding protein
MQNQVNIRNKKAKFEYHILDTFTAGIQLYGTEIKSIRESKASIMEAHCSFTGSELFIRNMHIAEYRNASFKQHLPTRQRKLLLNKAELVKIKKKLDTKGYTVIPLKIFIADSGKAKLEIALAQGKKLFDKREDLKQKDNTRELDRIKKKFV